MNEPPFPPSSSQPPPALTEPAVAVPQENEGVEPDRPPIRRIFWLLFALSAAVGVVLVMLWQLFLFNTTSQVFEKDLSQPNPELRELRAWEQAQLSEYDKLNQGRYQIPIEQAMAQLVSHPEKIRPLVAPASASAPPAASNAPSPPPNGETSDAGSESKTADAGPGGQGSVSAP